MSMLADEIRVALARYLDGSVSLREFDRWFTRATWEIVSDPVAEALADEIELRLSEYTSGHWTEEELRKIFRELQPDWIRLPELTSGPTSGVMIVPMTMPQDSMWASPTAPSPAISDTRLVTAPW